jgi:ABC-type cobalamin transport system ATPase subunit
MKYCNYNTVAEQWNMELFEVNRYVSINETASYQVFVWHYVVWYEYNGKQNEHVI